MFSLIEDVFLHLTPTGAYRAVIGGTEEPVDRLVRSLLRREDTPRLTIAEVATLTGVTNHQRATGLVYQAQEAGLVEGLDRPGSVSDEPFGELLDRVLSGMSDRGQVVLAGDSGTPLASTGFPTDAASRLGAMACEHEELTSRFARLLDEMGERSTTSMALVDRLGVATLGWWTLRFADRRLRLIIGGLPRFNQPEFTELTWALAQRRDGAPPVRPGAAARAGRGRTHPGQLPSPG